MKGKVWVFVLVNWFVFCGSSRPNFVLVLTDDQDLLLKGMVPLKQTVKLIGNKGVTFTNAFVNSPVCCPSRSTILTGRYAHSLGVTNNSLEGNCCGASWQVNYEPLSVASILKREAGYVTFYAGKYLNQYGYKNSGGLQHVPPGYDWWMGLQGNSKYYNYTLSVNGTGKTYTDEYLTDVIKTYALDFLSQGHVANRPFFMMLSPPASHAPFTPAPRHKGRFLEEKVVRNPAFNYSSCDKHWIVTMPPKFLPANGTVLDDIQRGRLQTLLAVDEMVEAVVVKLKDLDVLQNTYLMFTSDNGFHIGQFTQPWDKRQPYESDVRVPFLMSGPRIKKKSVLATPVSTVDVTPTILDLAKVRNTHGMDGISFKRHLFNVNRSNKEVEDTIVFVEYYGEGNAHTIDGDCFFPDKPNLSECMLSNWCKCQDSRNNSYVCVRRISEAVDSKFCRFFDDANFVEAYDLKADPYELVNRYDAMAEGEVLQYQKLIDEFLDNQYSTRLGADFVSAMPHFRLETNLPLSKIPKDLPPKICKAVAETLGKPLNLCVTTIIPDVNMSWGGSNDPAAQATLLSIGSMGVEENKRHSKILFELIGNELGIPNDRMYICFGNVAKADVGYTGTTFHELWP